MVVRPDFWKRKRVLLTGHTGFKGSWLALWLQHLGTHVTGYALRPPPSPNLYDLANVGKGMTSLEGDIRDLSSLEKVIRGTKPEIVIHMAAQSLVLAGYEDPVETYATNVMGTVHLLEAVRQTKSARIVIIVTSDKCYRHQRVRNGYREEDPLGSSDPYSNSKSCAELVTEAYRDSYFQTNGERSPSPVIASARSGNVIGGGDWAKNRLIPDMIRGFCDRQTVLIRYPDAVRPWQHVLEPLSGYLLLAQRLWEHGSRFASAWNFGPTARDAKPVSWVADRLSTFWGPDVHWVKDERLALRENMILRLDCSKARKHLGWSPVLDLERTLRWVVDWYRAWQKGADMRSVTIQQIQDYQTLRAS